MEAACEGEGDAPDGIADGGGGIAAAGAGMAAPAAAARPCNFSAGDATLPCTLLGGGGGGGEEGGEGRVSWHHTMRRLAS